MDALQYGALRVKKVPIIVTATAVVLCQHAVSTGAGALIVATEKTQLFTAAVVVFADVGACREGDMFMRSVVTQIMSLVKHSISSISGGFLIKSGGKKFLSLCVRACF